jgi:hypothetical protein
MLEQLLHTALNHQNQGESGSFVPLGIKSFLARYFDFDPGPWKMHLDLHLQQPIGCAQW